MGNAMFPNQYAPEDKRAAKYGVRAGAASGGVNAPSRAGLENFRNQTAVDRVMAQRAQAQAWGATLAQLASQAGYAYQGRQGLATRPNTANGALQERAPETQNTMMPMVGALQAYPGYKMMRDPVTGQIRLIPDNPLAQGVMPQDRGERGDGHPKNTR